jgi:hypothetical protein
MALASPIDGVPRLQINGEPVGVDPLPLRWEELLQTIDERSHARGHVVTAIRFNGVEESTFRRPDLCNRVVSDADAIDVTTATPGALLSDALDKASMAASTLAATAGTVARALRVGNRRQAAEQIAALGHSLSAVLALVAPVAAIGGVDPESPDQSNRALNLHIDALVQHYESLVQAQQARDWRAAANVLEPQLQAALQRTARYFADLRLRLMPPLAVGVARFAAVVCIYDDDSWLAPAIESVYAACDTIWFLVSDTPWNGTPTDQAALVERIHALPDPEGKIRIERGRWPDEAAQRNEGLRLVEQAGIEYCLVLDADEIYDPAQLSAAMDVVRQHPQIDCWRLSCLTYWKSCRYRVEPPEALAAPVFVRIGSGRFVENRNFEAPRQMRFAPDTIVFHHMSYARTDAQIQRKLQTWGHAGEVVPQWYENVWRKWDDDHSLQNLNPCWPSAYRTIVEQPRAALPSSIQGLWDGGFRS